MLDFKIETVFLVIQKMLKISIQSWEFADGFI